MSSLSSSALVLFIAVPFGGVRMPSNGGVFIANLEASNEFLAFCIAAISALLASGPISRDRILSICSA